MFTIFGFTWWFSLQILIVIIETDNDRSITRFVELTRAITIYLCVISICNCEIYFFLISGGNPIPPPQPVGEIVYDQEEVDGGAAAGAGNFGMGRILNDLVEAAVINNENNDVP